MFDDWQIHALKYKLRALKWDQVDLFIILGLG